MRAGDRVIVLQDPLLWGIGRIHHADKRGLLCIEFENGDGPSAFELFRPHELELADIYLADVLIAVTPA
jgi:hypothetical protein